MSVLRGHSKHDYRDKFLVKTVRLERVQPEKIMQYTHLPGAVPSKAVADSESCWQIVFQSAKA